MCAACPSVRYGELLAARRRPDRPGLRPAARRKSACSSSIQSSTSAPATSCGPRAEWPASSVGDELLGRVVDALGRPLDGGPPLRSTDLLAGRARGPGRHRSAAGPRADAHRHQGDRRPAAPGPRPARADPGRPRHGQDRHRPGRDPGPARHRRRCASTPPSASARPASPRRSSLLATARRPGPDGGRGRRRRLAGRAAIPGAVHRLHDRRVLHAPGPARVGGLRRPDEACRRLPADFAALGRPPGREAYPRRRLLPARPAAGAGHAAARPAGRRQPDRPADRLDPGRQHRVLHPDQPDLDHRRPDLPGHPPVQRRPAAGGGRRPERLARRRQGAAAGCCGTWPATCGCCTPSCTSWRRSPASAPSWNPRRAAGWSAAGACARRSSSRGLQPLRAGPRGRHPVRHPRGVPRRRCLSTQVGHFLDAAVPAAGRARRRRARGARER